MAFWLFPLESGMPRTPGVNVSCAFCGTAFYVPNNRKHTAKYCSRQCKASATMHKGCADCGVCGKSFEFIATRANTAKYCSRECYYKSLRGRGSVTYKCEHCEAEFKGSPSHPRKFCSRACVGKSNRSTFEAKFTTVRKQMLVRNMIQACQRCGYDTHPEILGVHHKDRNRNNNSIENLEVLCPNCHSLEHSKHISHAGRQK